MQKLQYYCLLIFTIFSFSKLNAQLAEQSSKTNLLKIQTEDYQIMFSELGDGKQNLSWEAGEKLFGMGGGLEEILQKLWSEYEWQVAEQWMDTKYYLRINYTTDQKSKQEVNQIFLQKLPEVIGANLERSRIKKDAICLHWSLSDEEALNKAQDRTVINQIMKRTNELKINSVLLQDLTRLISSNTGFEIKMEGLMPSSSRYDFIFNVEDEKSLLSDLVDYGFKADQCEVEKTQISLY